MAATFSAPVQTGPGAHPASYTVGTGPFPGVKRPGRGVNHPPPSSTEVKERVELFLYTSSGTSWTLLGRTLPLPPRLSFFSCRSLLAEFLIDLKQFLLLDIILQEGNL